LSALNWSFFEISLYLVELLFIIISPDDGLSINEIINYKISRMNFYQNTSKMDMKDFEF